MRFVDRIDAGRKLASVLLDLRDENPIVLALPRGGVPVGREVAAVLGAPLDVWVVRKVGAPGFAELGLGAVAEGGIVYLDQSAIAELGLTEADLSGTIQLKKEEVAQRVAMYRGGQPPPRLAGRTVILVDDGIATGGTIRAAVEALRRTEPKQIILAVPVAATQALEELRPQVDEVVCIFSTPELYAIGAWYDDFGQVTDEQVMEILAETSSAARPDKYARRPAFVAEVSIPIEGDQLPGTLTVPPGAVGLVLFAHGSGSSRFSPRNVHVASVLQRHGVATLLFDLLTPSEEVVDQSTREFRFDTYLLAQRLVRAIDWAGRQPAISGLPIGLFGASTGAAAALMAGTVRPTHVAAIVSRGGRPDLAGDRLAHVRAPTLLIVGGRDVEVMTLNRSAAERMTCVRELVTVPGATHLFEEPGALDAVARLAAGWFRRYLGAVKAESASPAPRP